MRVDGTWSQMGPKIPGTPVVVKATQKVWEQGPTSRSVAHFSAGGVKGLAAPGCPTDEALEHPAEVAGQ